MSPNGAAPIQPFQAEAALAKSISVVATALVNSGDIFEGSLRHHRKTWVSGNSMVNPVL